MNDTPVGEVAGPSIGRYRLLEQIGAGGTGVVWLAEQREPIRRRVALKIVELGMDTKDVIARFDAERQALARMEDPHIAKVYDAGATETGRPYFVMEYIKGIPILDYCDQERRFWRKDHDLTGLRDVDAPATLPQVEQTACIRLWVDVATLWTQAQGPTGADGRN